MDTNDESGHCWSLRWSWDSLQNVCQTDMSVLYGRAVLRTLQVLVQVDFIGVYTLKHAPSQTLCAIQLFIDNVGAVRIVSWHTLLRESTESSITLAVFRTINAPHLPK